MATPMIKLNPNEARTPKLAWSKIERLNEYGGELLAAFELLLVICLIDSLIWNLSNNLA